jgi:hypothetical protein
LHFRAFPIRSFLSPDVSHRSLSPFALFLLSNHLFLSSALTSLSQSCPSLLPPSTQPQPSPSPYSSHPFPTSPPHHDAAISVTATPASPRVQFQGERSGLGSGLGRGRMEWSSLWKHKYDCGHVHPLAVVVSYSFPDPSCLRPLSDHLFSYFV